MVVEFRGCSHLLASPQPRAAAQPPTCLIASDQPLQLWVSTIDSDNIEIAIDGQPLDALTGLAQAGGRLFEVAVPAAAAELRVSSGSPRETATWRLQLRPDHLHQNKRELQQAVRDLADLAAAQGFLERQLDIAKDPGIRGFIRSTLARIEYRVGNFTAAIELLQLAMAEHRKWHDVQSQVDDGTLMFQTLFYQLEDIPRAGELLRQLPEAVGGDATSEQLLAYYRGAMARRMGDTRAAIHWLTEAAASAHHFRLSRLRQQAEQLLALQLNSQGQHQRAASLLERSAAELAELPPCEAGQLFNNVGWHRLLAAESGQSIGDPLPPLQRAEALLAECDEQQRVNLQINLSLAHWQRGDAAQASNHLDSATKLTHQPKLRWLLWWREIEARIALSRGHLDSALELYSDLAHLAGTVSSPEALWRATLGEARSHRAAGRATAARNAFAEAEALLDAASLRIPIDADRQGSIAVFDVGTREYLELLLRQGLEEEALAVARKARSRVGRTLQTQARLQALDEQQRNRWASIVERYEAGQRALDEELDDAWKIPVSQLEQLRQRQVTLGDQQRRLLDEAIAILDSGLPTSEQLGSPAPGDLLLLYRPLTRGWVGFAAGDHGLTVKHLPPAASSAAAHVSGDLDLDDLASWLLEPFAAPLEAHLRVRVLLPDSLFEIDFHALPWRGKPLLATHSVIYGLDLPATGQAEPKAKPKEKPKSPVALLVADPSGTLPAAITVEMPRVQRLLAAGAPTWEIHTLSGPQATAAALRRGLHGASLLHFAGHADVLGRTDSHLRLASESRLALGEILTLPAVPGLVVLSACQGAGPITSSFDAGTRLGLAQAFLLAGSRQVIAATRPVEDQLTTELMAEFYRSWLAGSSPDEALRSAQAELQGQQPASDWAAFRLLDRR